MFKNYFKVAVRNLFKQKSYSLINVLGLAIGIATCLLILLFVKDELTYDLHNEKADRIFRLATGVAEETGNISNLAGTPSMWPQQMAEEFPELEAYARFYRYRSEILVTYTAGEKRFYEGNFYFADATVLDIFTLPFLQGDPKTALSEPDKVIISQSMARKYFGDKNPIGETIIYTNRGTVFNLEVTGVMQDVPSNAHLHPEFIASMTTFKPGTWHWQYDLPTSWDNPFYRTYILLADGHDYKQLEAKLPAFLKKHMGDGAAEFHPFLQPLPDIHLHSNLIGEYEPNGSMAYVYIFASITFLILLVACINYMNMATARSTRRAKEVGLRKTLGSNRNQLLWQFYGESMLISVIALLIALPLAELVLPLFNSLAGKSLALSPILLSEEILYLISLVLIIGFIAGSYPALYLSGFSPALVLKGALKSGKKTVSLRKSLVVLQFGISVFLIIATLIVSQQLDFFSQDRLGLDKSQVITIPLRGNDAAQNASAYKTDILNQAGVEGAATASHIPFTQNKFGTFRFPEMQNDESAFESDYFVTDQDFPAVFDLEIINGRYFSQRADDAPLDGKEFIINESAVKALGISNEKAIGVKIDHRFWDESGEVVGVAKDFFYRSKHQAIAPLVIKASPKYVRFLSIKIAAADLKNTLQVLETKWKALMPSSPFVYTFLDQDTENLYKAEEKIGEIFKYFSLMAILISCLGLFGLAAFAAEQRTKEIGIRKVLGASVSNIILLLSKEFVKLVAIANLIAWPLAYFAMDTWLADFAYRIEMGFGVFLLATAIALVIAILTVSYQAVRAAIANPVKSLRYE